MNSIRGRPSRSTRSFQRQVSALAETRRSYDGGFAARREAKTMIALKQKAPPHHYGLPPPPTVQPPSPWSSILWGDDRRARKRGLACGARVTQLRERVTAKVRSFVPVESETTPFESLDGSPTNYRWPIATRSLIISACILFRNIRAKKNLSI